MLKLRNYTNEWHGLVYCQLDSTKNVTFHKQLYECTTIECSSISTLCVCVCVCVGGGGGGGGEHASKARIFSRCRFWLMCYVYEEYEMQKIQIFTNTACCKGHSKHFYY